MESQNTIQKEALSSTNHDGYITSESLKNIIVRHIATQEGDHEDDILDHLDLLELAKLSSIDTKDDTIHTEQFLNNHHDLLNLIINTANIFNRIGNHNGRIGADKMQDLLRLLSVSDQMSRTPDDLSSTLLMAKLDGDNKGYVTLKDCIKFALFLQAPPEKEDSFEVLHSDDTFDTLTESGMPNGDHRMSNSKELQHKLSMLQSQLSQSEHAQIELLNVIENQKRTVESLKKKVTEGIAVEEDRNNLREEIEKLKAQENDLKEDIKEYQKREQEFKVERESLQKEFLSKEKELNRCIIHFGLCFVFRQL